MQYKILGKDLKVSSIGMGCMGISHAYGKPLTKKEGIYLIHKALDYGYNFLIQQKFMVHILMKK